MVSITSPFFVALIYYVVKIWPLQSLRFQPIDSGEKWISSDTHNNEILQMNLTSYFPRYFRELSEHIGKIDSDDLIRIGELIVKADARGKKIILAGNGGSAAMASHVAVDLVKAAGIRAINFNEADLITCLANDFGYEYWVEKALEFYADDGDLVILISSSGQSKNILNGATKALSLGLKLVTFSGFAEDNPLRTLGDSNFWVDSQSYNHVEMAHHVWLVAIIDFIIESKLKVE